MSDGHNHDPGGHHHERPVSSIELRVRAPEALLVEKGLVSTDAIDAVIELYENDIGPQNGAKSWRAPGSTRPTAGVYSPTAPRRSPGSGTAATRARWLSFQRDRRFIMPSSARCARVTRGRCSGCRRAGLKCAVPRSHGLRAAHRAARVQPRAAAETTIRVWDSTAEVRYLVLPERPDGTGLGRGAGRDRHARCDDRRRAAGRRAGAGMVEAAALADVDAALGSTAPLPRANGELVFEEVWQGRALGLGVVVLERTSTA